MAQQHYDGKKHKKNAAKVALLEQLGTTLDMGELRGKRNFANFYPRTRLSKKGFAFSQIGMIVLINHLGSSKRNRRKRK